MQEAALSLMLPDGLWLLPPSACARGNPSHPRPGCTGEGSLGMNRPVCAWMQSLVSGMIPGLAVGTKADPDVFLNSGGGLLCGNDAVLHTDEKCLSFPGCSLHLILSQQGKNVFPVLPVCSSDAGRGCLCVSELIRAIFNLPEQR